MREYRNIFNDETLLGIPIERNGGDGTASSITGTSVTYAGGGGGGSAYGNTGGTLTPGTGGAGGGGNAGTSGSKNGAAGIANTGGGGGGRFDFFSTSFYGGAGGSGIVIIRYADTFAAATATTGSPTITVAGGYRIYQWTSSGSITF